MSFENPLNSPEQINPKERIRTINAELRDLSLQKQFIDGGKDYHALAGKLDAFSEGLRADADNAVRKAELDLEYLEAEKEGGLGNPNEYEVNLKFHKDEIDSTRELAGLLKVGGDKLKQALQTAMLDDAKQLRDGNIPESNMKVEKTSDLPSMIRRRFEKTFDERKGELEAVPRFRVNYAYGVAEAALESGDFDTAANVIAFTNQLGSDTTDKRGKIDSLISGLKPEHKLKFGDSLRQFSRDQRNYKAELEEVSSKR